MWEQRSIRHFFSGGRSEHYASGKDTMKELAENSVSKEG